jgi:hypothetical protein
MVVISIVYAVIEEILVNSLGCPIFDFDVHKFFNIGKFRLLLWSRVVIGSGEKKSPFPFLTVIVKDD